MSIIRYILIASVCLSLFYIVYRLIFNKERNFRQLRIYLLGSIVLSLLFPFSSYRINTGISLRKSEPERAMVYYTDQTNQTDIEEEVSDATHKSSSFAWLKKMPDINWTALAINFYLLITILLMFRIALQLLILFLQYVKSDKARHKDCILLYNHRFQNTFSFFRWIFVQTGPSSDSDVKQIIAHEKIHVTQYHSFDLLVMELLTAVMWFNPLIWMMKKSMQLVHEYLADEGALNTGIDRLRYQVLLINQVTEGKLICLSSSFNRSLIKKRMIMMTTSKFGQKTRSKLLALIPVSASLIIMVSVFNGAFAEHIRADIPENLAPGNILEEQVNMVLDNPIMAGDTITKQTIIKIVNSKNPKDTIVRESTEIIVTDDTVWHKNIFHEMDDNGNVTIKRHYVTKDEEGSADHKKIKIHTDEEGDADYNEVTLHMDENGITERHEIRSDSVKIVKVIRKGNDGKEETVTETEKIIIRNNDGRKTSKILYIIDGVVCADRDPLINLDPKEIDNIRVVKDENIKKYTNEDCDGVIVIETKKEKK
jgi:hypothetical protein